MTSTTHHRFSHSHKDCLPSKLTTAAVTVAFILVAGAALPAALGYRPTVEAKALFVACLALGIAVYLAGFGRRQLERSAKVVCANPVRLPLAVAAVAAVVLVGVLIAVPKVGIRVADLVRGITR